MSETVSAISPAESRPNWRRFLRFSLRSLMLLALLVGSVVAVVYCWEPWVCGWSPEHLRGHFRVTFSNNGERFVTCSYRDNAYFVWLCDGYTGHPIKLLTNPGDNSVYPFFHKTGKWVLMWTEENYLKPENSSWRSNARLFSADTGRELLDGEIRFQQIELSNNGIVCFCQTDDNHIQVRLCESGKLLSEFTSWTWHQCFSNDGTLALLEGGVVASYTGREQCRLQEANSIWSNFTSAFSPDNRWVFVSEEGPLLKELKDKPFEKLDGLTKSDEGNVIHVFDTQTGNRVAEFSGSLAIECFTPDRRYLISNCLWETQLRSPQPPFEIIHRLEGKLLNSHSCSCDGQFVITYLDAGLRSLKRIDSLDNIRAQGSSLEIWDLKTAMLLEKLQMPSLVGGGDDPEWNGQFFKVQNTLLWDSVKRTRVAQIPGTVNSRGVQAPALTVLSNNGKYIVTNPQDFQYAPITRISTDTDLFLGTIPSPVSFIGPHGKVALTRDDSGKGSVWIHRRDPGIAGFLWLPQLWLALALLPAFLLSLWRDWRMRT